MPPSYDNIIDAFDLIRDGLQHTVDFDTTGCTMETNESTDAYDFPEVWAKIDLSDPDYGIFSTGSISVTLKTEAISGVIIPEIDIWSVNDVTFDPSSPDFSKVGYIGGGAFLGDGTTTPAEKVIDLDPTDSVNGVFYLWISDWNFDLVELAGVQRLTYTVPKVPVSYCVRSNLEPNLSSPTVSVTGDNWVRDEQLFYGSREVTTGPYPFDIPGPAKATFYVRGANLPPPGLYYVRAKVRVDGDNLSEGSVVSLRRNGVPMEAYWDTGRPNASSTEYTDYVTYHPKEAKLSYKNRSGASNSAYWPTGANPNPMVPNPAYAQLVIPRFPIVAGDEIEVVCSGFQYNDLSDGISTDAIEIYQVCFDQIVEGGAPGSSFDIWDIADDPIGFDYYGNDGLMQFSTHDSDSWKTNVLADANLRWLWYFTDDPSGGSFDDQSPNSHTLTIPSGFAKPFRGNSTNVFFNDQLTSFFNGYLMSVGGTTNNHANGAYAFSSVGGGWGDGQTTFSAEVWVRGLGGEGLIIGNGQDSTGSSFWGAGINSSGFIYLKRFGTTVTTSIKPSNTIMHHFVVTCDGTTCKLYQNMSEIASLTDPAGTAGDVYLAETNLGGGNYATTGSQWGGVAGYDDAMSVSTIKQRFRQGFGERGLINTNISTWNPINHCIVELDSGDVYCVWTQGGDEFGGESYQAGPYIAKWDGSTWEIVERDVSGFGEWRYSGQIQNAGGSNEHAIYGLDITTDGTHIWIVYLQEDDTYLYANTSGYRNYNQRNYVKKYTPGSGLTDLGNFVAFNPRVYAPSFTFGPQQIKVGGDGSLWVVFSEADDVVTSFDYPNNRRLNQITGKLISTKAYLAEWTGGTSWSIHEVPAPVDYDATLSYSPPSPIQASTGVTGGTAVSKTGSNVYSQFGTDTQTVVGHTQTMNFGSLPDPYSAAASSFTITVPGGWTTNNGFATVRVFSEGTAAGSSPVIAVYVNGTYKSGTNFAATNPSGTRANGFGGYVDLSLGPIAPGDVIMFKIGQPTGINAGYKSYADSVQLRSGSGEFQTNLIEDFTGYQVCLTMCHHGGASNLPSVIYDAWAERNDSAITAGRNQFVYSEWNGSGWSNTLRFLPQEIANSNVISLPNIVFGTSGDYGHWQQGMTLFDNGTQVYLMANLGYGSNWLDITLAARLKADGSEFECFTEFGADTVGGIWGAPCFPAPGALFDERGTLIAFFPIDNATDGNVGTILAQQIDTGTGGWIPAAKTGMNPGSSADNESAANIFTKGNRLYIFDNWYRANTSGFSLLAGGQLAPLIATRTNDYDNVWIGGVAAGPLSLSGVEFRSSG